MHLAEADAVVWLDLPKPTIMRRVVWRTIRRAVTREKLFGRDVTEPLTNFYRLDPAKNIIRWAWVNHGLYVERYSTSMAAGEWDHLEVFHLRSPGEVAEFLRKATGEPVA